MQECKVHSAELHHLKKQKEKVDEVSDSILRYTEVYWGILVRSATVSWSILCSTISAAPNNSQGNSGEGGCVQGRNHKNQERVSTSWGTYLHGRHLEKAVWILASFIVLFCNRIACRSWMRCTNKSQDWKEKLVGQWFMMEARHTAAVCKGHTMAQCPLGHTRQLCVLAQCAPGQLCVWTVLDSCVYRL